MVSHSFFRPSFLSINSAVLPLKVGQKLNLTEILFKQMEADLLLVK